LTLIWCVHALGCEHHRDSLLYRLDSETRGWVVVVFNHTGAAPLARLDDGSYLVPIPKSGVITTSTNLADGRAADRFIIRHSTGEEEALSATSLRANQTGWERRVDGKPMEYEVFFIGSDDELRAAEPSEAVVSRIFSSLRSKP
jgi:hypothetical protein